MVTQVNPNDQKQILKKLNYLLKKKKKLSPLLKNFYFQNFKKKIEALYFNLTS